ncbi:MAG: FAD-dependent monooxygenase [Bacteroidia bacterium]|nr:FAD-dependent monooxygenase [Bacteroidia bacterium]
MAVQKQISIFGAGLVGSLLALFLAKRGHKIKVYEKMSDMRKEEMSAGRSINLALSDRGWRALDLVGVGDDIRKVAIPMKGRLMHGHDGSLTFQSYGKEEQCIYSVSRGGLNMSLMDFAEADPNVELFFNQSCKDVNLDTCEATVENEKTSELSSVRSDLIFGADGGGSAVRQSMNKFDDFNFSDTFLEHGYKELTIPAINGNEWAIEKEVLHIWPRGNMMLIALPNLDGSFTCTLFFPMKGEISFESLKAEDDIMNFFNNEFPDVVPHMPTLVEDFLINPSSILGYIKCAPWTYGNKVALIGDAAHAIVPFYGQGMNAGFEDCTILNEIMDDSDDWQEIFHQYELQRKENSDAICDLALRNFIEMRDLVADPDFLYRKKIEAKLYKEFPDKWIPLYSMVTFTHMPYSEALQLGEKHDKAIKEIMEIEGIDGDWEKDQLKEQVSQIIESNILNTNLV